ncbi:UNVERIFIED_CONTAM: hypothetical protein HDU68_000204 [Siphonaria sp. JEL0065]|nr:hypothetical protein HDU68_000204 [Siphonaria sp. JEL0065]
MCPMRDPSKSHESLNNYHPQPNPTFSVVHLETRAEVAWTLSCSQQQLLEFEEQQHILYSYNTNSLTFCEDNEEDSCFNEEEYFQESGVLLDNQDFYGNQRQWTEFRAENQQASSIFSINDMDRQHLHDTMVPSLIHDHNEDDGDLNSSTSSASNSVDDSVSEANSGVETRRQSEVDFGVYVQEILKARKMARAIVAESNGGNDKLEYSSGGDGIGGFEFCGRRIGGAGMQSFFDNSSVAVDKAVTTCNNRRRFGRDDDSGDKEEGDTDVEEDDDRVGWNGPRNATTKILSPTPKAPLTSIVELLTRY